MVGQLQGADGEIDEALRLDSKVDNTIAFHWAAEKFRSYPIMFQDVGGQKADFYF